MQFIEIIKNCNKIVNVSDVLNNFDLIIDIVKEDVLRITKSKQIFFTDFDFAYNDGVNMLKNQLAKIHLKAIRRFFESDSIEDALKWIVSRIINNAVNITTNKKYKLYSAPQFCDLHEKIESSYDIEMLLLNDDLMKFDKNTLERGLKKVWEDLKYDLDFDYFDMEYLCKKFGLEVSEIVENEAINLQMYKKEQTESGNSQLVFVF